MKIKFFVILVCCFPLVCQADFLPQALGVPGGIAEISLGSVTQARPKVFYNNNRVLVCRLQEQWLAVIGIPLTAQAGLHTFRVETENGSVEKTFWVENKHYPEQHLSIANKRLVDEMQPDDLKRIAEEKNQMELIKAIWTEQEVDTHFKTPVEGRLSSLFGLKRFINENPRQPHNGLDIAAKVGTPIHSPSAGKVIGVGNFYFNGNTVFLDHGQGLISVYLHMSRIEVKLGQLVKQGDKLGKVGATGRVTGPHLHWIIYLNKETVDPALFIGEDLGRLMQLG